MKAISLLLLSVACASEHDHIGHGARLERMLQQCYQESDSYSQRKSGHMKAHVILDENGNATSVKILSTTFTDDPNLKACVTGIYQNAKYPAPKDGHPTELVQPVNFIPVIK